ncbi:MAG: hypothetical protein J7J07_01485, partial [Syntrophobacterales bacterium]|nr:hypothetical protein [Syntrophobacterales bacterium]
MNFLHFHCTSPRYIFVKTLRHKDNKSESTLDALVKSSAMPFYGIVMESNFYKACLRPMGAS